MAPSQAVRHRENIDNPKSSPKLRELSYAERLQALNLTTRRTRGALITLYWARETPFNSATSQQENTIRKYIRNEVTKMQTNSIPNRFIEPWQRT